MSDEVSQLVIALDFIANSLDYIHEVECEYESDSDSESLTDSVAQSV